MINKRERMVVEAGIGIIIFFIGTYQAFFIVIN